jgi:hypothetical protein
MKKFLVNELSVDGLVICLNFTACLRVVRSSFDVLDLQFSENLSGPCMNPSSISAVSPNSRCSTKWCKIISVHWR